jgi:hypothetical protein
MSLENCIYEICVYGTYSTYADQDEDESVQLQFYKIRFRILDRFGRYEVWIFTGLIALRCGFFDHEIDAKIYINQSMKTAMLGQFLYRECIFCKTKNYYPSSCTKCIKCHTILYPIEVWQIDETQNEKKSKHLGFSLIRYESPSRSKSFIQGSQAAEKLPDL